MASRTRPARCPCRLRCQDLAVSTIALGPSHRTCEHPGQCPGPGRPARRAGSAQAGARARCGVCHEHPGQAALAGEVVAEQGLHGERRPRLGRRQPFTPLRATKRARHCRAGYPLSRTPLTDLPPAAGRAWVPGCRVRTFLVRALFVRRIAQPVNPSTWPIRYLDGLALSHAMTCNFVSYRPAGRVGQRLTARSARYRSRGEGGPGRSGIIR